MPNNHYSKAPIIEAVIDIQVTLPSDLRATALSELAESLSDKFPISSKIKSIQMRLDASIEGEETSEVSSTHEELGLRLEDKANSRVLQLRKNGFTYSHLAPYSNWDCFCDEAKAYWGLFVQQCKPESVSRCAVRYINRIDIPKAPIEIEDYLTVYPHIPKQMPQTIIGMQMQLQMLQQDIGALAVVNEAVVEPAIKGGFSIIVDVDLFKMLSLDPKSDDVWTTLGDLRARKNSLFEGFITDMTRELIK